MLAHACTALSRSETHCVPAQDSAHQPDRASQKVRHLTQPKHDPAPLCFQQLGVLCIYAPHEVRDSSSESIT